MPSDLDHVRVRAGLDVDGVQQVDAVIVLVHVTPADLDEVHVMDVDEARDAAVSPVSSCSSRRTAACGDSP